MRQVRFRVRLLTAPTDAILQYRVAVWKFVNTVLDKVEEEDEGYRTEIANVLKEFKAGEGGIVVTQDNVLQRLREL